MDISTVLRDERVKHTKYIRDVAIEMSNGHRSICTELQPTEKDVAVLQCTPPPGSYLFNNYHIL